MSPHLPALDIRASSVELTAGQFGTLARYRAPLRFREALDGVRVALRFLDFVEPIVGHAIFRDRLDQAEVGLGSASRAAEGLSAIVDVVQASEV
jgi:hypothetical protein